MSAIISIHRILTTQQSTVSRYLYRFGLSLKSSCSACWIAESGNNRRNIEVTR